MVNPPANAWHWRAGWLICQLVVFGLKIKSFTKIGHNQSHPLYYGLSF
jgi:hypothetical protein